MKEMGEQEYESLKKLIKQIQVRILAVDFTTMESHFSLREQQITRLFIFIFYSIRVIKVLGHFWSLLIRTKHPTITI